VRNGQRIAVEIKSFVGPSDMRDLEVALGTALPIVRYSPKSTRIVRCFWPCRSTPGRAFSAVRWTNWWPIVINLAFLYLISSGGGFSNGYCKRIS
jgi:hypothetical protein